jgi:hypothetical protein
VGGPGGDRFDQVRDAGERAAAEPSVGQLLEPALYQVEP